MLRQNKLECLPLARFFIQINQAELHHDKLQFRMKKFTRATNTPAYFDAASVTKLKKLQHSHQKSNLGMFEN